MESREQELYKALLKAGKKIEAIQIYRTDKKCSLEEAKTFLDNLEKQISPAVASKIEDSMLTQMLQNGKDLQAIKLYKQSSGCSLKEAKDYIDNLKRSGNIYSIKTTKTKFEGCFIATVCYGGYDTPEVIKLRNFRDEVLLKSLPGKIFVKLYYRFSPGISKVVSKSETMKVFIRKYFLDKILNCINQFK
jgi:ribosomal protein L7/L12